MPEAIVKIYNYQIFNWNHIIGYEIIILDKNTWKHDYVQIICIWSTLYYEAVCKQMIIVDK